MSSADLVFEVLFKPVTALWSCTPTFARKWVKGLSVKAVTGLLGIVWCVMVYCYLLQMLISYFRGFILMGLNNVFVSVKPFLAVVLTHQMTPLEIGILGVAVLWIVIMLLTSMFGGGKPEPQEKNAIRYKEKAMQGSDFMPNMTYPAVQALLLSRSYASDGTFEDAYVGSGFRDEFDNFVTAQHNVEDERILVIQTDNGSVVVPVDRWRQVPFQDIAYVRLEPGEYSILGMKKGSYERNEPDAGERYFASIYGPENHTIGSVQGVQDFGQVVYSGSTAKGYSGAPYVSHHKILGMHLGHGVMNGGPSGAYLKSLFETVRKEDSDEVLLKHMRNEVRRGKDIRWEEVPTDPECVRFKWGKGYRIMDKEDFFAITNRSSFQAESQKSPKLADKVPPVEVSVVGYDDSKNSFRASAALRVDAGASGRILDTVPSVQAPPSQKPAPIHDFQSDCESDVPDMESQELTLARQRKALEYMLNNIIVEQERRRRRKNRRKEKPSGSQSEPLDLGLQKSAETKKAGLTPSSN